MDYDIFSLQGFQRSYLKKLAHRRKPVVMLGQHGLSPEVLKAADQALNSHELIKIKFQDYKAERRPISEDLARQLEAQFVNLIGNILTIYRQNREPDQRIIRLPQNRS
ncbi:YhbY family RNA-binding protein [Spirochaeta lutea]|uniref:CRM domain-containing protein n=1 Tax=Spirochaeta lutea TaxID=1480694 RepID=A0A098R141_9SPIO|nr:YhbY family RNA-binding protein [Spirochaeta lutea]KGE72437.1 hypothetical protein DC28_07205 [Spirochaeta lutea]